MMYGIYISLQQANRMITRVDKEEKHIVSTFYVRANDGRITHTAAETKHLRVVRMMDGR